MLKITELRKEKGLTQTMLAEELNISVKKLGAWEQNRSEPCIADLCRLASFFGCTVDELTGHTTVEQYAIRKGLTPLEQSLLSAFRTLNENEQQQAINILAALKIDQ